MAPILSIHSYRGGTGKSNLVANLAWLLAAQGKRVGVIDTDLQSPGVHMVFEFDTSRITYTLSDFLFGKCQVDDAAYDITQSVGIASAGQGRLLLLPSSLSIEAITRIVAEGYDAGKLNDSLATLGRNLRLDYMLLDTHPGMNKETMLTTAVSTLQMLVVRPDTQDFHGTAVLLEVARRLGVQRTFLIANKVVSSLGREAMQQMVQDAFGAELIGCLPLSEEMASLGSRGLFCRKYPQHAVARELYAVSQRVIADLA